MYKQILNFGVALFLCVSTSICAYAGSDQLINPVTELQSLVTSMQQEIAKNHDSLASNPDQMYQIVQKDLMPDMAVNRMSAMALGPKWRTATDAQKQAFIQQFSFMLTRAYVSALLKANDYTVVINPMRDNSWENATVLALPGVITSKQNGQSSNVTYYVVRHGNRWQVYDFAVEGVSIMQNFQAQLQTFPDMDAVIARIKQVNAGQGS